MNFSPRVCFLVACVLASWTANSVAYGQYYDDEEDGCMPDLADDCFLDVEKNIACHLNPQVLLTSDCSPRDEDDMCSAIDDALRCTSDIIDTSCRQQDGRSKFDAWLQGQRAVYLNLCGGEKDGMKVLLDYSVCWNINTFLTCTEQSIGINHVNDLLRKNLDLNECNRLLVSMATCNVKATIDRTGCHVPQETINEMLHTFFSATKCSNSCDQFSNSGGHQVYSLLDKFATLLLTTILILYIL